MSNVFLLCFNLVPFWGYIYCNLDIKKPKRKDVSKYLVKLVS